MEEMRILSKNSSRKSPHFVKSPFRYPGGKFYALKYILPYLENVPHDEYREPFVGGGSIYFAKAQVSINWINDIESEIIAVYRALSNDPMRRQLNEMVSNEIATPKRHREIKEFNPNNDLEKVFRTYYLNRTSYSGIINSPAWGYAEGKSSPPKNWKNFIESAGKKLQNVKISNLDFEEVIKAPALGRKVLIYLDPPYFHADQKRAYIKSFSISDHIRLANALKNTKFLFCLSYDDCVEIKDLYNWAEVNEYSWLYNTANCTGKQRKKGNELIITNYEIRSPLGFL